MAFGHRGGEVGLRRGDRLGAHVREHVVSDRPRIGRVWARDHVKSDAEAQRTALVCREGPHAVQALGYHLGRLAPCEIHVDVGRRDALGRRRRSPEVHGRRRIGHIAGRRPGDLVEVALEVERLAGPCLPHDLKELARSGIARVLVEPVAETVELTGLGAGDNVEQQPATRETLVRGSHLCGERG